MSDKPIAVGDLVMVVRNCSAPIYFGTTFKVRSILFLYGGNCSFCGKDHTGNYAKAEERYEGSDGQTHDMAPVSWLKRIDPPAIDEDVPEKEELTA